MVNFAEENVCTGVDPQECARIANVLSLETAVQGEEIARLQGVLEQYLSREDDRANHEKILGIGDAAKRPLLEPTDFVDQPSDGAHLLYSLEGWSRISILPRVCNSTLSSFSA